MLGRQGGDPVQTGRLQVRADAGRGEHAAVADQRDAGDAETLPDLVHLPSHRGRIGRVPGEHLDRQGAASGRAQQPEHDQGGVLEVPVGEAGLDPALTGQQPVEHGKHLVARDGSQAQQGAEAGVGGFR